MNERNDRVIPVGSPFRRPPAIVSPLRPWDRPQKRQSLLRLSLSTHSLTEGHGLRGTKLATFPHPEVMFSITCTLAQQQ